MVASGPLAAPLRLLVVLAVVGGLLAAVPASCWCPPDDHFGQLLHPLVAHTHPESHPTTEPGQVDASDAALAAAGPSWASAMGLGTVEWQGGIQMLPPSSIASLRTILGPRLVFDVVRPAEHLPKPLFPPPR